MNPPDQPTPTPRTDEAAYNYSLGGTVSADFARTLERELAEAKAECERFRLCTLKQDGDIARLRAELAIAENWVEHHSQHADDLISENARLRAEVERLNGMRTAAEAIMTDVAEANEEIAIARAEKAEAELISLRAEVRQARKAWLGGDYDHLELIVAMEKFRNDRETEFDAAEAERDRLRAEVERLKEHLRIESAASAHALHWAEKAEAALAFIAENGGTTHETECGTIACNGLWCAEQARAAMKSTP